MLCQACIDAIERLLLAFELYENTLEEAPLPINQPPEPLELEQGEDRTKLSAHLERHTDVQATLNVSATWPAFGDSPPDCCACHNLRSQLQWESRRLRQKVKEWQRRPQIINVSCDTSALRNLSIKGLPKRIERDSIVKFKYQFVSDEAPSAGYPFEVDVKNAHPAPGRYDVDMDHLIVRTNEPHPLLEGFLRDENSFTSQSLAPAYWLKDCLNNHPECGSGAQDWFPTRLIKISDNGRSARITLTANEKPDGPYLTLSHRWGESSDMLLTKASLVQFTRCIEVSQLPKTFRDTLELASRLGIGYAWIDTLCVLQDPDDLSDWAAESHVMDKVYSNAKLNIAAAAGKDNSEPLAPALTGGLLWPQKIHKRSGRLASTYYVMEENMWQTDVPHQPMLERGWIFQEIMLAPRILFFGKRQLAWECKQKRSLEASPGGCALSDGLKSRPLQLSFVECIHKGLLGDDEKHDVLFEFWTSAVDRYSHCKLTHSRDRLIALEGVVNALKEAYNGLEYFAGIWRFASIRLLCWYGNPDVDTANAVQIAPSWSWASVADEAFGISYLNVQAKCREIADLVAVDSGLKMLQTDGSAHGWIQLQCDLFNLSAEEQYLKPKATRFWGFVQYEFRGSKSFDLLIRLNVPRERFEALVADKRTLFMVPLVSRKTGYEADEIIGLLVTQAENTSKFHRIGMFELESVDVPLEDEMQGLSSSSEDHTKGEFYSLSKPQDWLSDMMGGLNPKSHLIELI